MRKRLDSTLTRSVPSKDVLALMQTTVGEHIRKLQERLRVLSAQGMQNSRTLLERNRIEAEIRAVNLALACYKAALELKKKLSPG